MSIRQHRIDSIEKIKGKIAELQGKTITLVLANNTSVLGELISVDTNSVVMKNGRLTKNRFSFTEIKELYFDQTV
jgi:hypothetical protein